MHETEKPLLAVLKKTTPSERPVWLMRQAGRYLPEYRELRAKAENFLNLCLTPALASEITLQPLRRFPLNAAILFADILLIPLALGARLEFRDGEGPVLQPVADEAAIAGLSYDRTRLSPVYETLDRVKTELPPLATLIGFCGGPWTVACYMVDGSSRGNFTAIRRLAENRAETLARLIDILVDASADYLGEQIKAGAEVVQIFDSWAGLLQGENFRRWVIEPTRRLISRLRQNHPDIPVIGFPREAGDSYEDYARFTGIDALSIDQQVDLAKAQHLQKIKPLQGNLDPALLVAGGEAMKRGLAAIMEKLGSKHIVNLGHGVVPGTPPEHVAELVDFVHRYPILS